MPSKKGERQRRPLAWNETQLNVLAMVFKGRHSQAKVAEFGGIPLRTCERLIAHPEFQARLKAMREDVITSCEKLGYAYMRKEQRMIGLSELAESARTQYEERPLLQERRQIGYDKEEGAPILILKESFNREAFDAVRGALDDIAKELGHRKQVVENTIKTMPYIVYTTTETAPLEPIDDDESD